MRPWPTGRSWCQGGAPADVLRLWLAEVRDEALAALGELDRVAEWRRRAEGQVADLNGRNSGKILEALAARPYASASDLAEAAAISRDTVGRILKVLEQRGIAQEITGRGRFRLWRSQI